MSKTIHQIWINGDPAYYHLAGIRNNYRKAMEAGWSYKLHTNVRYRLPIDLWALTRELPQDLIDQYSKLPCCSNSRSTKVAHVVDLLRYKILSEGGGMYLDCDDYLFVSPEKLISYHQEGTLMALDQSARSSLVRLTNACLYDSTGESVSKVLERALEVDNDQWGSTGPGLLESMYGTDPSLFSVLPRNVIRYSGSADVWKGDILVHEDRTPTELIFSPNGSWCTGTHVRLIYKVSDLLPLDHDAIASGVYHA